MNEIDKPPYPILLLDDEPSALRSYQLNLRYHGYTNLLCLQDSREAPALLERERFSLVVLDLNMPHLCGEELLKIIVKKHPGLPVIVVTGHNEVETAVRCMRAGALHFLLKPLDRDRLLTTVDTVLMETHDAAGKAEQSALVVQGEDFSTAESAACEDGIVAADPAMLEVRKRLRAVAVTKAPALILGETGVGKELAARAVHTMSGRSGRFVALNAAGLEDAFFADTLFGHSKGAYTNAQSSRGGLIESAAGGSLFLDEIGDLSFASQLKLLRLIQEREYYPLGSDTPRPLRAKIIAATNRSTTELMDPAVFRRDLFFRLRTHMVLIPPLRERPLDIPVLSYHFLKNAAHELGVPALRLTPDFLELLACYSFPGNVRELEAMLYNALALQHSESLESPGEADQVLSGETLHDWMALLPPSEQLNSHRAAGGPKGKGTSDEAIRPGGADTTFRLGSELSPEPSFPTLKQAQERVISEALRLSKNNQAQAARMLGISRQALNRRLNAARKG
jgi:DNA-binding NtrC family response regulator